jgi:uncharacterized membrane protein YcaP (DUF421 family)
MDQRYEKYLKMLNSMGKLLTIFQYVAIFVGIGYVIINIVIFPGVSNILYSILAAIVLNLIYYLLAKFIRKVILLDKKTNEEENS